MIGQRIKQARLRQGLTQQVLAERCGFTKSLLSKIENGQTASAVATLSKIANELNLSLAYLLAEEEDKSLQITKRTARQTISGNNEVGYSYETLANPSSSSRIEPTIVHVLEEPITNERFTHNEDEFIYVLLGEIQLSYGEELHHLEEGDSAYFKGTVPHVFLPINQKEAKVLTIFIENY